MNSQRQAELNASRTAAPSPSGTQRLYGKVLDGHRMACDSQQRLDAFGLIEHDIQRLLVETELRTVCLDQPVMGSSAQVGIQFLCTARGVIRGHKPEATAAPDKTQAFRISLPQQRRQDDTPAGNRHRRLRLAHHQNSNNAHLGPSSLGRQPPSALTTRAATTHRLGISKDRRGISKGALDDVGDARRGEIVWVVGRWTAECAPSLFAAPTLHACFLWEPGLTTHNQDHRLKPRLDISPNHLGRSPSSQQPPLAGALSDLPGRPTSVSTSSRKGSICGPSHASQRAVSSTRRYHIVEATTPTNEHARNPDQQMSSNRGVGRHATEADSCLILAMPLATRHQHSNAATRPRPRPCHPRQRPQSTRSWTLSHIPAVVKPYTRSMDLPKRFLTQDHHPQLIKTDRGDFHDGLEAKGGGSTPPGASTAPKTVD
ncbi:hypothetical protein MAPG_10256 [Magnaporthiopsis poae ATCC 64411]|uniref:Uncharacterized protein n=1 Tax=Magnaporthiopsis poae (strain ATCC 64411 / 73-15) TaxID=644358 RepID=A0A0C4EC42_MAGP6|nr:hypothetical protein MAPG_10256 [Magnaporthiopsis poae ATCC 64411]